MKSLLLVGLSLLPLGAIWAQSNAPTSDAKSDAKPAVAQVAGFAPLDYFQANCQRCHGPNGTFYGPTFGKNLKDDAAMREAVKAMCEGPGQAPLDAPQLEVLTTFHLNLRDGKPFITVVSREKTVWSGEATPDSKITLESGEKVVPVKLEGHKWSVEVPVDFDGSKAKLRAVKDGKESLVELK